MADINAYLTQCDVWDRYDGNGDGNFNQPDHYTDHFQIIHAGEGEDMGGGAQGSNAIRSHRWYAFHNNISFKGPPNALLGAASAAMRPARTAPGRLRPTAPCRSSERDARRLAAPPRRRRA